MDLAAPVARFGFGLAARWAQLMLSMHMTFH